MKKLFICLLGVLASNYLSAQNTFPTASGSNVGIGTINPTTRLQVTSGTTGNSGVRLTNLPSTTLPNASNGKLLSVDTNGNIILNASNVESSLFAVNNATTATTSADYFKKAQVFGAGYPRYFSPWGVNKYGLNIFDLFNNNGTHPYDEVLLSINDRAGNDRIYFSAKSPTLNTFSQNTFGMLDSFQNEIVKISDYDTGGVFMHFPKADSRIVIGNYGLYKAPHKLVVSGGSALIEGNLIIDSNIGIGTNSFVEGTDHYRLSVEGAVRAHRVKVYTTWADYVFEKNYNLPSLEEVEDHIIVHGHLKDIPSSAEVERNGIELGNMNKLLLQKIEELTLYIIKINKELNVVKNELNNK